MGIRLAIHEKPGSYSDRWIAYCREQHIDYETVNCLDTRILNTLKGFDGLLWHWDHGSAAGLIAAYPVIRAAEMMGLLVLPDSALSWHYDDKLSQKYLLEAISAPLVPTHVFYRLDNAIDWINTAEFPKVFKLKRGAGSQNVTLVHSRKQAMALARQAFGKGFRQRTGYFDNFTSKVKKVKSASAFWQKLQRAPRILRQSYANTSSLGTEANYLYFQDFIPDNAFDTRVTIIGDRAFAFRRRVLDNDFRASGSGQIDYDRDAIDRRCIEIAFEVASKISTQSLAFDFLFAPSGQPLINEISYCYVASAVHACQGHWNRQLEWVQGPLWPEEAMMEDFIAKLRSRT